MCGNSLCRDGRIRPSMPSKARQAVSSERNRGRDVSTNALSKLNSCLHGAKEFRSSGLSRILIQPAEKQRKSPRLGVMTAIHSSTPELNNLEPRARYSFVLLGFDPTAKPSENGPAFVPRQMKVPIGSIIPSQVCTQSSKTRMSQVHRRSLPNRLQQTCEIQTIRLWLRGWHPGWLRFTKLFKQFEICVKCLHLIRRKGRDHGESVDGSGSLQLIPLGEPIPKSHSRSNSR